MCTVLIKLMLMLKSNVNVLIKVTFNSISGVLMFVQCHFYNLYLFLIIILKITFSITPKFSERFIGTTLLVVIDIKKILRNFFEHFPDYFTIVIVY